ncbi:MAG: YaiI/YqxD family protein [Bacillota bacterium]
MKIIMDADATPVQVLEICREAAEHFGLELWTVASFNHRINSKNHITVGDNPQEADLKIINISSSGDVVVTQDYGLAAVVLARGVSAISPVGKVYRPETIDFLLEEREMKAKFRRGGGRTRGPAKRTENDNVNFRKNLLRLLEKALHK